MYQFLTKVAVISMTLVAVEAPAEVRIGGGDGPSMTQRLAEANATLAACAQERATVAVEFRLNGVQVPVTMYRAKSAAQPAADSFGYSEAIADAPRLTGSPSEF